jgi:FAD/FMN-containing dehydrogenase
MGSGCPHDARGCLGAEAGGHEHNTRPSTDRPARWPRNSKASVLGAGEPGWDAARGAWNLAVDQRPALVVRAACDHDVQAAVRFAADAGLRSRCRPRATAPRRCRRCTTRCCCGSTRSPGSDRPPPARRAWVCAATPATELVAAAAEHGLWAVVGSAKDVSVAGLALGGGIGHAGRRFGLAVNHVTALEVVTADGLLRRVDARRDPSSSGRCAGPPGRSGSSRPSSSPCPS